MLKGNLSSIIKFILFLSLGVFLLWITTRSLSSTEINAVKNLIYTSNPLIVLPCMVIVVLSHYIRALRWKMLITPLSYTPKNSNVFFAVIIGFFFNLLFPRLGELMKCTMLGKHEKIPVNQLIGTMVAERIVDVICLALVISLTIASQFHVVGEYAKELWTKFVQKISIDVHQLTIYSISIFVLLFLIGWLFKKMASQKRISKIKTLVIGATEGLMSIRHLKNKPLFFLYTFMIWFLYLSSIKIGFMALSELTDLGWIPSITILTFGSFAMIVTQGGIGAYQLAVQKTLGFYGINQVVGLAFGWLIWSLQTLLLIIFGPISMGLMSILNKNKNTQP